MGRLRGYLPRKSDLAWPGTPVQVMTVAPRAQSLPLPLGPAARVTTGLCWGRPGVSELIRFLRFQRSPNPVSLAVIVTTSRFWPWQAVEDRRCVETQLCPALALDGRLEIGTAFPGLLGGDGDVCWGWGSVFL